MEIQREHSRTAGQLIKSLLGERGWTNRILSIVLDMPESGTSQLLSDRRPVTAEIAVVLEELFNVRAEEFLDLQKSYDLGKARLSSSPDPDRTIRAHLFGGLPISAMLKRGWITADGVRDVGRVQSELMRFFGVNRINDIETLPHAAKKTQVNTDTTPAQLAWLYRVKAITSEMLVAKYSPESLQAVIRRIKPLLSAPEEARKVPRILAEGGIRFAVVESLPAAKVDGVCFWLNDTSPVIALSMRFDRIDNFWFVLRHELEHVSRRHGMEAMVLDAELVGESAGTGQGVADEERVANAAASDFCVPTKMMDAFIARKDPFFNERDIIGFARSVGVHPGLVAGQLRHRTGKYNRWANHLVKIRSSVAPNAIVDGWGDVVPVEI